MINKEFTPRIRARQVTAQTDILEFMVLFFLSLFLWTNVALSQVDTTQPSVPTATEAPKSFEDNYKEGVQHYQNKSFDKAQASFQNALLLSSLNLSTLTNLGLVSFELGNKGLAIAYLRRALEIDWDFSPARAAYDYIWSQLEVKEVPHRIETYETIRENFLSPFSLTEYLWFGGFCFLISGWLLIRYLGQKRRALQDELPLPQFPSVGAIVFTLFIVVFLFTGLKIYDLNLPRATIIAAKVSLKTAPSESETNLLELSQGFEVILRKVDSDWLQVTYPGGPTGWVKKTDLMVTSQKGI